MSDDLTRDAHAGRPDTFRLRLADALRPLADPVEITGVAARLLGEWLGANRVVYVDVRPGQFFVGREYVDGVGSIVGAYDMRTFGTHVAAYRQGRTVVATDVDREPTLSEAARAGYRSLDMAAYVSVPLLKHGEFVAALAVHSRTPRAWTPVEVGLVEETAERTWAAVERAKAEEALRASEARHRALFDSVDEGVCLFERLAAGDDGRRDYRYVAMNPAMQRMFGIPDLSGRSIRESFPDEIEDWYDDYDRVLETGTSLRFVRESAPQGLVLEMFVTRLEDGSGRRLMAVMQDVTARTHAERALQESEARHTLLLAVSDAVRALGDPLEIQHEACRVLAVRLDVERACCVEVDDDRGLATVARDVVRGDAPSLSGVHRLADFGWSAAILRRGECLVVDDVRVSPLVSDAERRALLALGVVACAGAPLIKGGRFVGAVCVTDSRPRAWSPPQVRLIQEVAERLWAAVDRARAEAALRVSEEQLRDADRRKDEFLATLAHELRNPLAPIRTGLELIRMAGTSPAAMARVTAMMERQVTQLVRLTDDLLDVARITSGRIDLKRESTPLAHLVHTAIEANRAAMGARDLRLHVSLPATPCLLDVDPTRFVQVLSNLLHNATKFTDRGGEIRIDARVATAIDGGGAELALVVADSGAGISAAFLPHVFDWFSQDAGGASPSGLGIGLALARRLVEMQDGRIEVASDGEGRGSAFTIRLPLSARSPVESDAAADDTAPLPARVVAIDDNRDAAESMAMLVEAQGGECRVAFDGESGLRVVREMRPDVVLLDLGIPGIDGFETCRRLRREHGDAIVVVAVTGYGQPHDRDDTKAAGFDAHLTKPADLRLLRQLLRSAPLRRA